VKARLINLIAAVRTLLRSESRDLRTQYMTRTLELILEALANPCSPIDRAEYRRVSVVFGESRSSGTEADILVCLTALPTRSSSDSCLNSVMLFIRPCTHHTSIPHSHTPRCHIFRPVNSVTTAHGPSLSHCVAFVLYQFHQITHVNLETGDHELKRSTVFGRVRLTSPVRRDNLGLDGQPSFLASCHQQLYLRFSCSRKHF
jgi:hypothetical protein